MSYYPPHHGAYGNPYAPPPMPQYAAGTPVYPPGGYPPGGYPASPAGYPPAAGYPSPGYPPQHHAPPPPAATGAYPATSPYPATAAYPSPAAGPYGYAAPPAAPPAPAYGYPAPAPAAAPAPLSHAPTMATTISHAPTMATLPHAPTIMTVVGAGVIMGGPVPSPQQDAETIHRACKGFGTDEKSIISVVANRTPDHLGMVTSVYRQMYGRDMVEVLDKETSGNFGRALHYIVLAPFVLDAELVHEACKGAGTNERCLIQVLVGRTNAEMHQIKSIYYARYHQSMESMVKADVSAYFEKLLMISIQGTKDEMGHYTYNVEDDVRDLYKAGEGRLGTDESTIIRILTNRPNPHLQRVFQQYHARHSRKFTKVIKKEFSGWIKTALCYLVNWIINPAHCVAKNMEKAMVGAGTDDHSLIRLVVRNRTQPFMNSVKAAYAAKYRKSLRDRIKGETSGDYRRLLLAAIGEPY